MFGKRRFPATVRADYRNEFARFNRKAQAVKRNIITRRALVDVTQIFSANHLAAINSISQSAPIGNSFTATQLLAGLLIKYFS